MLSSDLKKLADSYTQIAEGGKHEKNAMDWNKSDDKPKGKVTDKKKVDKCTSESFYLKRLQAMNPVFAEQYLAIAEILIEEGYENSRLIDNIVEAFPPEMVGYEFISALKAVNPRLHENLQSTEKRQAKAIVMHFSESHLSEIFGAITSFLNKRPKKNPLNPSASATIPDKDRPADMKKGKVYGDPSATKTTPSGPTPEQMRQKAAEQQAKTKQQMKGDSRMSPSSSSSSSSTSSPSPAPKPKKPTGPITSRAAIAAGSKEGQGPKSAASTYRDPSDKKGLHIGRHKTLADHQRAVAANNKKSMSEGSVFESLKKARENVGASTCWDGYKAKGTKKKNGKEVPNCVKEEDLLEAPYGVSPNQDPMVPKSHNERMKDARDKSKKQGVFLPPWIGPEPKRVKAKPTTQMAGYEPEGEMVDESSIGDRTRKVVGDQRQGVHGDDDAIRRDTNSIKNNLLKMRPYGAKGFPATVNSSKDKKTTQVAHFEPEGKLLEGIRDKDSEKGTKERKERLEKKRGMKVDDHPEYLETNMKKRQENNEKARKDMDKVKGQKNPHFEDVSHYDVILAFLSENNLIESVEEAEEIMMQLTGAQIVEIIDEFMSTPRN